MSTEQTQAERDFANLAAFIKPDEPVVAGVTLRPLSAGSYALLGVTKNELINPTGEEIEVPDPKTGAMVKRRQPRNAELEALAFIFIHAAPLAHVRRVAFNEQLFREAVLAWADELPMDALAGALEQIGTILAPLSTAKVEITPKPLPPGVKPDSPPPNS